MDKSNGTVGMAFSVVPGLWLNLIADFVANIAITIQDLKIAIGIGR